MHGAFYLCQAERGCATGGSILSHAYEKSAQVFARGIPHIPRVKLVHQFRTDKAIHSI